MRGGTVPRPDWEERYATGDLPWDTGAPDVHLVEVVRSRPVAPGTALEVGCGTGTNAIWLAQQGFAVTGVDISARAVEKARAKAEAQGARCVFLVTDFLRGEAPPGPYDFVFDRGCFHVFDEPEERRRYAELVAGHLRPGGCWLSLIGCTEGPAREHGPPRRSLGEVLLAVEPQLQILEVRQVTFRADVPSPVLAWRFLSQRRETPAQPSSRRG